jgi:hypothetical protein
MKITRPIVLAAMAAGACFGTENAFAQACITAAHGGAPGGQGGTFLGGTQESPCPIADEEKVFLVANVAHTSSGSVGANHGPLGIAFASSNAVAFANGWSTIKSTGTGPDASFPNLHISALGSFRFTDLTFDLQMANNSETNLLVETFDTAGDPEGSFFFGPASMAPPASSNSNSFPNGLQHDTDLRFDIENPTGMTLVNLVTTSPSGISEVKQIQVSGFTGPISHVPEPSTFALMVLGVVGVVLAGARRTRRTRPERDFLWHRNAGVEELGGAIA